MSTGQTTLTASSHGTTGTLSTHEPATNQPTAHDTPTTRQPPTGFWSIVRQIGPGLIVAGSIVGSGELIATTKTGGEVGFTLLWLIILGCAIKTFAQIALGRHTIIWSQTTLSALDEVPGPRFRVNWIMWYWAVLTVLIITQQGGIVGGIGQALSAVMPLTEAGRTYDSLQEQRTTAQVQLAQLRNSRLEGDRQIAPAQMAAWTAQLEEASTRLKKLGNPLDPYLWAVAVAVPTSVLLYVGHYTLIQILSTALVVCFTFITGATLIMLQFQPAWAVTGPELLSGLTIGLPSLEGKSGVLTALATFGLIGVGSAELIFYPYWCLEKGYAQYVGTRDGSQEWASRARGWLRVLQVDAWLSMVVFTFSTVAFYLLGAAVLWRCSLVPENTDMVRTLMAMYVPVFGSWAPHVFLLGAIAVLYSTYFVASASNAQLIADGLGILGMASSNTEARKRRAQIIAALWPLIAVALYASLKSPIAMILICGVGQTLMLPIVGGAAIWFRYYRNDPRLHLSWLFDAGLWLSMLGFIIVAGSYLYIKFAALIR